MRSLLQYAAVGSEWNAEMNMAGDYQGVWVRVQDIESTADRHMRSM